MKLNIYIQIWRNFKMERIIFSAFHTVVDGYNLSMTVQIYDTESIRHDINSTLIENARAYAKEYGIKNRIELNRKARDKYNENPEPVRLHRKVYYGENKDAEYRRYLMWKDENPEQYRLLKLKEYERRKEWGINPINKYFNGAHFHHTHIDGDHSSGIYIPKDLHKSVCHSHNDEITMNKINAIAFKWLLDNSEVLRYEIQ